jgi:hypothetical protein
MFQFLKTKKVAEQWQKSVTTKNELWLDKKERFDRLFNSQFRLKVSGRQVAVIKIREKKTL